MKMGDHGAVVPDVRETTEHPGSRPTILLGESRFGQVARATLERAGVVLEFENPAAFVARLPEADAVVIGLEVHLQAETLARADCLRVIATRTTGLTHIDLDEAARRGITILPLDPSAPALRETTSTAELAFALLLALVRNIPWAFDSVKDERWERHGRGGRELKDKTLGIVGFGRLGRMVAGYGAAFGMRILAYDRPVKRGEIEAQGAEAVSLERLLRESDAVSIHVTSSQETRNMIGAPELGLVRPTAVLVNTARGEVVDEGALLAALEDGRIAGAAIDTLAGEREDGSHLHGNPLVEYARTHENLLLLPHLGGTSVEATERTQVHIAEQLVSWLAAHWPDG
jgi:D-3-phosphoglycerate dehydrogenase